MIALTLGLIGSFILLGIAYVLAIYTTKHDEHYFNKD